MKDQEIVNGCAVIADGLCERVGRLHRKAGTRQPLIQRDVPHRDCAGSGMLDYLPEPEILEAAVLVVIFCILVLVLSVGSR